MSLLVTVDQRKPKSDGTTSGSAAGSQMFLKRSNTSIEPKKKPKERSARHASQSLDELVRCAICLEQLHRPTMLPCQHTFCLACLELYVKRKSTVILCPTCRCKVTVPADGIGALPTNILLQAFLESLKKDSNNDSETTTKEPSSVTKTGSGSTGKPGQSVCFRCSLNVAPQDVLPCRHCNRAFCKCCHLLHVDELKTRWSNVVEELFAESPRLSIIKEESKTRYKKLRDNVRASIAIQIQQLIEKENQLLGKLKNWHDTEVTRLVDLQEQCERILANAPTIGCSDEKSVPDADVLKSSETILHEARLCGSTRWVFDSEELSLTCESTESDGVGVAAIASSPAPTSSPSTHVGSPSRRVAFMPMPIPESPDEAKKPFEFQSSSEERSVHYRSMSSHPRQRIASSHLQRPAGVAVSPWTGDIYVAATDSHRVYVIDKSGKIVKSLGSPYRSEDSRGGTINAPSHGITSNANCGTFLCPFGIAFSTVAEEIYVTDKWLNCIQVFNKEGVYDRQLGVKGTSPGHFRSPEGIAVDSRGFIYVCDTCNDRVQVLDRNGVYIRELGTVSQMTLPGGKLYHKKEFNEPTGVAVSPDGSRVAVCDFGNCRIKVFNSNGELIVVFGFRGTQRGQFQHPECLAVDDKGFILVGDSGNGRVQVFRPNGKFVRALGTKGAGSGQFNWISGLTLSKDMEIIAADFKNHCIQIF